MINQNILIGNLTADAEVFVTSTGKTRTSFTVAVNEKYYRDGEEQEATYFIRCVAWNKLGENASSLKKGDRVIVLGKQVTRSYEDNSGNKKYITEVQAIFIGRTIDTVAAASSNESNFNSFGEESASAKSQSELPF